MEVAQTLFTEQGYERTSLREIAEQVGVTKAALYYHFASKEELIRALLEPMTSMELEFVDEMPDRPSVEEWADMLDRFTLWMIDNAKTFQLLERNHDLFDSMHEDGQSHMMFHHKLEQIVGDPTRDVEERIRMAAAVGQSFAIMGFGGELLGEVDPELLAKVLSESMRRTLDV
ncbi:TetR family transcriptional regulator [soil metagenome]